MFAQELENVRVDELVAVVRPHVVKVVIIVIPNNFELVLWQQLFEHRTISWLREGVVSSVKEEELCVV